MDILEDTFKHLDESKDYIELVDKLTTPQTLTLDSLIKEITDEIKKPDYMVEIDSLQIYYLKLTTELYLMVDKLKQFEIYSSLAKANESEKYNEAYLKATIGTEKKPTIAELQIAADIGSKKESLINTVYASAFKSIKNKIDAGNLIADTLKHIIKVRTNIEFTAGQLNNIRS